MTVSGARSPELSQLQQQLLELLLRDLDRRCLPGFPGNLVVGSWSQLESRLARPFVHLSRHRMQHNVDGGLAGRDGYLADWTLYSVIHPKHGRPRQIVEHRQILSWRWQRRDPEGGILSAVNQSC